MPAWWPAYIIGDRHQRQPSHGPAFQHGGDAFVTIHGKLPSLLTEQQNEVDPDAGHARRAADGARNKKSSRTVVRELVVFK
jgi:hypothetical protein